eukprot:8497318-Alexandrium_andersonii.AAC.1
MKHVKGHSGEQWNEAVDRLAKRGAGGERCQVGRWAPGAASAAMRGAVGKPITERSALSATACAAVHEN